MIFEAVFLDADNTLFDFDRTQSKAISHTLNHFSLPTSTEAIQQYERINKFYWNQYDQGKLKNQDINRLRWWDWLNDMGQNQVDSEELASHYAQSLSEQCEIEEGANQLIDFLVDKVPVHIITNGFPSSQLHRWGKAGWDKKIQGITVSAEVKFQKPEPEIFYIAMESVGVENASRCLMVGDSLYADVQGPQNVGMKACWYQRNGAENSTDIKPDIVVKQLTQLISYLD